MTTVELDVISADLAAFLDKVAHGETILIASNHRPLAELRPPSFADVEVLDEEELARRRKLVRETDELRASIRRESGVNPDSADMIREMRDNE
jgi:antitoxin (DNA-binding transcriptional repressor) of toxin-antitoxin stability system